MKKEIKVHLGRIRNLFLSIGKSEQDLSAWLNIENKDLFNMKPIEVILVGKGDSVVKLIEHSILSNVEF